VDVNLGVLELSPPPLEERPESLTPAMDAFCAGDHPGGEVLEFRRAGGKRAVEIASIESLVGAAQNLDVLARRAYASRNWRTISTCCRDTVRSAARYRL
jgi:hypothetical protein